GLRSRRQLDGAERTRRGSPEGAEEVALETRKDCLGLRIAEPAVELEHSWPILGEHEACVQEADEGRAPVGQLREDGPVYALDEFVDLVRAQEGQRRVAPHAAGVRAL